MRKNRVSRRDFLRIAGMSAAAAAFAGCAQQPTQQATQEGQTDSPQPAANEPVTLRMWHWDNFLGEGYKPVTEEFTAKNPNIKVAIEITDYGEYSQKIAATIAGGTPPDVAGTVGEHFTSMAGNGQLIDLKPFVETTNLDLSDYHEGNLSQNSWGGKLLAIPYTADGMWTFFHKDAFAEKGLKSPYDYWKEGNWTWDTAKQLAEQLTTGEGIDKVFGWGGMGTGNYFEVLPYMASNGSGFFDDNYTTCQLTDPKVMDVYQWGYDMRAFSPGPEDQQNGTPASGRVMMWVDWSPFGQAYAEQMPFEYSYAPPPASPTTKKLVFCGDAPGFGILSGVKHPDESWKLIDWINQAEPMKELFLKAGQEPPRMSVAQDPALWAANTTFKESSVGHELTVARFKEGFYNSPKISNWLEIWQAHNEEVSLIWSDDASIEDGLTTANNRINDLLKEGTADQDRLYWS